MTAPTFKASNAPVVRLQLTLLTGLTAAFKLLFLAPLTTKKATKEWAVLSATTILYIVVTDYRLKSKLVAVNTAQSSKWSTTGMVKDLPQATSFLPIVHLQMLFHLL